MKQKSIILTALFSLLLVGCGSTPSNPDSGNENGGNDNSEPSIDEEIILKTYGDLYLNGFRSIHAQIKNGTNSKIKWISSNPKVVSILVRPEDSTECFVSGDSYGKATVTASLVDYPDIKKSIEFEIKEGKAMPALLYDKINGGMKVTTDDYSYSYSLDGKETLDEHYKLETIYEEIENYKGEDYNSTDAFHFKSINTKNNKVTKDVTYVRGDNDWTSEEYLTMHNTIGTKPIVKADGEGLKWQVSLYSNFFNNPEKTTNEDFRTFDGGKTYHYVGFEEGKNTLIASMYLVNLSVDDLYFTVNGDNLTLTSYLEPFRMNVTDKTLYGRKLVSSFSEIDTAKVDHVKPYKHEPYHNDIEIAFSELRNNNNYSVDYSLKFKDGNNEELRNSMKFNEGDIYYESKIHGADKGKFGVHKTNDDSYYDYTLVQEIGEPTDVIITKEYKSGWADYAQYTYPHFNFSSEIFTKVDGKENTYETVDNYGAIVLRCLLLGDNFRFYEFPGKATIELDANGSLKSLKTDVLDERQEMVLEANFHDINKTKINVDFDKAHFDVDPTTWKEENASLFAEMEAWNIQDAVPFMHAKNGYTNYIGKQLDDSHNLMYASIKTQNFNTSKERDEFIEAYKKLLVKEGFVDTNTTEPFTGYELYKKGSYSIGVGINMNRRHNKPAIETDSALIIVQSPLLVEPEI